MREGEREISRQIVREIHRHNGQGMGDDDFDDEAGMVRSPWAFYFDFNVRN